jgi:pyruvate,water dikinase
MPDVQMLFSLQKEGKAPARAIIGGKAASLVDLYNADGVSEHVPGGFALSSAFFQPWVDVITASEAWKKAGPQPNGESCAALKALVTTLATTPEQAKELQTLREAIDTWPGKMAAVRSSAPEEDGEGASFAGVFDTKLGVLAGELETAVRDCFASRFDQRAFSYAGAVQQPAFAAIVMEMVDAYKAGVAFSANPLNSDLDELMVDSSWGLGESVVDGSIVADRFLWDKLGNAMLELKIGSKERERRLRVGGGSGVEVLDVPEERRKHATLSSQELADLASLVLRVEASHGRPVDVEWAYTKDGVLKLLQARPITTIFPLDPGMLTAPGEPRVLYFDFHIASDATTIHPFTHMDLNACWDVWTMATGFQGIGKPPDDREHLLFNGASRQYINVSASSLLGYGTAAMASEYEMIDLYAASILKGDEAMSDRYKAAKLPADVTFGNAWRLFRRAPLFHAWRMVKKFKKNPVQCGEELTVLRTRARGEMKVIVEKGPVEGLVRYVEKLAQAAYPALDLQIGGAWVTVGIFKELGKQYTNGETQQIRDDASAMMLGYIGDPLMEMNIAMYHLARELPENIWEEHEDTLPELAKRIHRNVIGAAGDLPAPFVASWKAFVDLHGYDGIDQLFVSSPRYHDNPVLLLEKLRHSVGPDVSNPEKGMQRARERRQEVQERQLSAGG